MSKAKNWDNRIVGYGERPASEFVNHPLNARVHSLAQQAAMDEVMNRIGWVGTVAVSESSGRLVDGHMRVARAYRKGPSSTVQFRVLRLTEAEEAEMLATFDAIADMAVYSPEKMAALVVDTEVVSSVLLSGITSLMSAPVPRVVDASIPDPQAWTPPPPPQRDGDDPPPAVGLDAPPAPRSEPAVPAVPAEPAVPSTAASFPELKPDEVSAKCNHQCPSCQFEF